MNAILLYVVQSALCLSLFYGLYLLLLRRDAFFRFNRNVLLAIMVSSMIIPLIRIPVSEPTLIQKVSIFEFDVSGWAKPVNDLELETSNLNRASELAGDKLETSTSRATFNMIPLAYLAGFLVSLMLALVSLVSVVRIIVAARSVIYRQQRILVSPLKISSFTFAGWIVLSEMDYERFATEIVTHEAIHRRKGHFWDLCLISAITVVHWFNPLVWLLRCEMKALHEYEADRSTLTQGIDATRYQLLLIEKAAGASRYTMASSFAQSKIKKRIVMMNKQNLNPWARWKALLFIPLAALILQAFARPEINRELEQISTLKSTEVLQENPNWTKGKFLEELRKCLPADVSHDLSYEDTWNEIAKTYHFEQSGTPINGMVIMMNRFGKMLVDFEYTNMEDIPRLLAKSFADKKITKQVTINGKKVDKIIRYTLIQRDVNAPKDTFQRLLNSVGIFYTAIRIEVARKYYQTDYDDLDADKKTVVDDVVPMMVAIDILGDFSKAKKHTVVYSDSPDSSAKFSGDKIPIEEEWKKAVVEIEKIDSRQITFTDVKSAIDNSSEVPQRKISTSIRKSKTPADFIIASNAFTPNDDGDNVFEVKSEKDNPVALHIFNRFGELVFRGEAPKCHWDGNLPNGEKAPAGVYFYVAKIRNLSPEIMNKGTVKLLR